MADPERTEEARPRQIEEAREKGMIPTSMEMNTAFVVLCGFLVLRFFGNNMLKGLEELTVETWRRIGQTELSVPVLQEGFLELVLRCAAILGPLALILMLVGVAVNYAQVGPLLSFKIISPDFARLDPSKGFKQLFSKQGLMETLKSIMKMLMIGYVAFLTIRSEARGLNTLMLLDPRQLLIYSGRLAFTIGWRVALMMLIIASFDYAYQRWQHKQDLKITPQEAKQADKDYDLDPHIKRLLREKQIQMATTRMMQEVPEADVVIVNPEHVAVALRYERAVMMAPTVVAKGIDHIALRIKQIAIENKVPVIEDKPLAWTLYESTELGTVIPEELYLAVSAILRRIYQERGRT